MDSQFVHLHTHSEYSLLDGASRIDDMVARAKKLGMPALALTDHGVMYGSIKFYEAAKKAEIKPIVGCEVYVAPRSRFEKSSKKEDSPYHLTLLAKNSKGYKNLLRLVTLSFFDGFYYKPRVDKELLEEYSEGLIALSGCLKGEISKHVQENKVEEAKKVANEYSKIFGSEDFYIEIQNQNLEEQQEVNKILAGISSEVSLPLVATNDTHYTYQSDSVAQDALLCIQTGSIIEAQDRLKFKTNEFYLKSSQEMKEALPDYPEALTNTLKIAEKCNVDLDLGKIYLPHYQVPEDYNLDSYLEKLCLENLSKRYENPPPHVKERLSYELEMIKKTGFSGYFLIVWDFVSFAKRRGIRVGPGRGSAAGSIVAYVLGITNVDPLKHGLLFERFLNPERISLPDIDIDFCYERRNEVINYVAQKYGKDRVAQIITFGTMAARAATRDSGRVFNLPYGRVDKIAKLIPFSPGTTIDEALRVSPELKEEYESDEDTRRILDTARALEGLSRQDSIHAAGVVISQDELTNYTPLQKKGDAEVVTQYPMEDIQKIGLLKMDFLGLRTLTVIDRTLKIIEHNLEKVIDVDNISWEDKKTFKMLQNGESGGVFQLESSGMRSLLKDLKPTTFADVVALLALYRPGPLGSNMVKDFVDRKHRRKSISYPHPSLEPILKDTYGIIVYQEQVMKIASTLAGFSMAEADILRKAMSKKEPAVLAKQRKKFMRGADDRGIDKKTAGDIFDLVTHFAGYGFNKSHSCAYATVSYQTAYLKANYPVEYMAALLTSIMDNKDKIALYVNECRRLGIEVLPPDVNESFKEFTVVGKKIRFGLSAVRNVGDSIIESIIESRKEEGNFKSIYDFCEKVDLTLINKRALESLIKAGAFDSCSSSRKALLISYERAVERGLRRQKDLKSGQFTLFELGEQKEEDFMEEPVAKEEFPKEELLAYEKEMLGLYVSDHPLLEMGKLLEEVADLSMAELREREDGAQVTLAGIVSKITRITTKKGEMMVFLTLEDLEGSVEAVVFPSIYQENRDLIAEDKVISIEGRLDIKEDEVKFIALKVSSLEEGKTEGKTKKRRKPAPVHLRLTPKRCTATTVSRLKEILQTHPGSSLVFLELQEEKDVTTLQFGSDYKVRVGGSLLAELKELLGEEAVAR